MSWKDKDEQLAQDMEMNIGAYIFLCYIVIIPNVFMHISLS